MKVVWLKVELCRVLEEKRSAVLRLVQSIVHIFSAHKNPSTFLACSPSSKRWAISNSLTFAIRKLVGYNVPSWWPKAIWTFGLLVEPKSFYHKIGLWSVYFLHPFLFPFYCRSIAEYSFDKKNKLTPFSCSIGALTIAVAFLPCVIYLLHSIC